MTTLHLVGTFLALVVLMSLIEHQVHCRLMHKKPRHFPFRDLAARKKIFINHAVTHHRHYRKEFHDDPVPPGEDHGIRLNYLEGFVEALVVSLLLYPLSAVAALLFPVVVCLHHLMWNQIHMEMHKPEGRFFCNWKAYKYVARHHFLHHRYPDKNFNVALPIGDYLFGTVAKATAADWQAMLADGLA